MFVNLSKHTYIIYTYTALFYHRILRYLIFVIIYNPLEIYIKKNASKFLSGTVEKKINDDWNWVIDQLLGIFKFEKKVEVK